MLPELKQAIIKFVPDYFFWDEYGNDYIEKLIPYEFKHGKNHGENEGHGYLLDIKTDAKGLEPQLDELKNRFWKHISKVHERLMDEFDKASKKIQSDLPQRFRS